MSSPDAAPPLDDDARLRAAAAAHEAGRLAEAEAAYRAVLAHQPTHPDALHLLRVVVHQRGNSAKASR